MLLDDLVENCLLGPMAPITIGTVSVVNRGSRQGHAVAAWRVRCRHSLRRKVRTKSMGQPARRWRRHVGIAPPPAHGATVVGCSDGTTSASRTRPYGSGVSSRAR